MYNRMVLRFVLRLEREDRFYHHMDDFGTLSDIARNGLDANKAVPLERLCRESGEGWGRGCCQTVLNCGGQRDDPGPAGRLPS